MSKGQALPTEWSMLLHATPTPTDTGPGSRFILGGKAVLLSPTEASQQEAIARILQRWRERFRRPRGPPRSGGTDGSG